jgi:hypothetical protein
MATTYHALRHLRENKNIKAGDTLVLFGELFSKGYANGLVEEAKARGLKIIYSTVGRRDKDGTLRPLNTEELSLQPQPLINVPLEAGFDLEVDESGKSICDLLKDLKLSNWEDFVLPSGTLETVKKKGRIRFQNQVRAFLAELKPHLTEGSNVIFAHLMAGGVPRAKIVLPLMNRVVKGSGDRFLFSEKFVDTEIGKLVLESFNEVTAESFRILLEETTAFRKEQESQTGHTSYLAYGYHGTEVLMGGNYVWQSYSPYLQGWAKLKLEGYALEFHQRGAHVCVYNCPEILTNSSSIFSGVEVSLYPLLAALRKESPDSKQTKTAFEVSKTLLKPEFTIDNLLEICREYLSSDLIRNHCVFNKWPQHNAKDQLEKMLNTSDRLVDMHQSMKSLITFPLSEIVFSGCGRIMLNDCYKPEAPVAWINHDIIAKISH